jgi:rod shape-determining protein MreB
MQLFGSALAIDLGTANTRLWARDQTPMVREASAVAYMRGRSRVVAIGSEARDMARRQAENVDVVDPIARGTVASFSAAVTMMRAFLRRAMPTRPVFSPTAVVAAPAETTGVEYRALRDVLRAAGISRVYSVPKSLAACIGAGLPLDHPESVLVIDLGAGVTEIAVVAMGMATASSSMSTGGIDIDEALRRYLWRTIGVRLSRASAEDIKLQVGSTDPAMVDDTLDLSALTPPGVESKVSARELAGVLEERMEPLIDEVSWVLGQLGPKQQSEIHGNGGVLTGGGALLRGLPEMLSARLGIRLVPAEDPLSATVLGLSAVASDIKNRAFDEAKLLRMGVQGFHV